MSAPQICHNCGNTYANESDYLKGGSHWLLCSEGHLWFDCACGSTLMLRKGKFPWFSPTHFMSQEAKSVFNHLGAQNIPHLSHKMMSILRLLNDKSEMSILVKAFKKEPLLASEVMSIASYMKRMREGDNTPISTISHALIYIGTKAVSHFIMMASLRLIPLPPQTIEEASFWKKSYLTGMIGEKLLPFLNIQTISPDEAYLSCSLLNIGKLIASFCFPDITREIVVQLKKENSVERWSQIEQNWDIPNHIVLGEIGAVLWGLPSFVLEGIRFHHTPRLAESPTQLDNVAALANQICHWILLETHHMDSVLFKKLLNLFKITEAQLFPFIHELSKETF